MTEREWQECAHPLPMLECLGQRMSLRKSRLFLLACCRRIWGGPQDEVTRFALAAAEHLAAHEAQEMHGAVVHLPSGQAVIDCGASDPVGPFRLKRGGGSQKQVPPSAISHAMVVALECLACSYIPDAANAWFTHGLIDSLDRAGLPPGEQAALLRDLLRGPFRPPLVFRADWRWRCDSAALRIAQTIYDEEAFEDLPILADALEDVGCDSDEILAHLRQPAPHVRGCWPLDLVLALG